MAPELIQRSARTASREASADIDESTYTDSGYVSHIGGISSANRKVDFTGSEVFTPEGVIKTTLRVPSVPEDVK